MQERLQKILSGRGIASRRKAEELIEQGLVLVNGKPATLGQKADPDIDSIEVAGGQVTANKDLVYYLLNKPRDVLTSSQIRREERTVASLLPENLRGLAHPVGRLDKDSEGLLLLTNDGVLAYRLTHPKFDHEKEYEVTTRGKFPEAALMKMEAGIHVLGSKTKKASVRRIASNKFRIAITEGRNRQIRRMVEKLGDEVSRLRRVRIMTLEDDELGSGQLRKLSMDEIQALRAAVGL